MKIAIPMAGGRLCMHFGHCEQFALVDIADLDTEPGLFHGPDVAASVYHHGFDRNAIKDRLYRAGFVDAKDVTAHVIHRPIANGEIRDFPVFLIVGHRDTK